MVSVKNYIRVNGAQVIRINGKPGKRVAISKGNVDFPRVEIIKAWHLDTVEMVKNRITEQGFKKDSINIVSAHPGQYNVGVVYSFTAELDIAQEIIEQFVEAEKVEKINSAERAKISKQIKAKMAEIEALKKEMDKISTQNIWL